MSLKRYSVLICVCLAASLRVYFACGAKSCIEKYRRPVDESTSQTFLDRFRASMSGKVRSVLPSPHSELLLGMTIGLDDLKKVPKFRNALITTGTIHVVVVSGFNINLMYGFLRKILGKPYKLSVLFASLGFTLFYALITGFEPPIIRAWIMSSVVILGKYYGRSLQMLSVLIFSAAAMLVINPELFVSLSFELSFLSTLGLVLFGEKISGVVKRLAGGRELGIAGDLSSTISAQLLVWPLISYAFGRVSMVSFVVNPLILWTVPISTVLGMLCLLSAGISKLLGLAAGIVVYPFLDVFVRAVEAFSFGKFSSLDVKLSGVGLCIYYALIVGYSIKTRNKHV